MNLDQPPSHDLERGLCYYKASKLLSQDSVALPWDGYPPNGNLGPCTSISSFNLAPLYGVPHGSSSANHRGECHQLGHYWPLTTRLLAAWSQCFKFFILTISSTPLGAWPLLLLIYYLDPQLLTAPNAHFNSLILGWLTPRVVWLS